MMYIGITVLFYATFVPMPSTPQYLLKVNKEEVSAKFLSLIEKQKYFSQKIFSINYSRVSRALNDVLFTQFL